MREQFFGSTHYPSHICSLSIFVISIALVWNSEIHHFLHRVHWNEINKRSLKKNDDFRIAKKNQEREIDIRERRLSGKLQFTSHFALDSRRWLQFITSFSLYARSEVEILLRMRENCACLHIMCDIFTSWNCIFFFKCATARWERACAYMHSLLCTTLTSSLNLIFSFPSGIWKVFSYCWWLFQWLRMSHKCRNAFQKIFAIKHDYISFNDSSRPHFLTQQPPTLIVQLKSHSIVTILLQLFIHFLLNFIHSAASWYKLKKKSLLFCAD